MSETSLSTFPDDDAPELNPHLDRARFAQMFERTGRVHIPNVLTAPSAQRMLNALERETPWSLIYNEGKKIWAHKSVSSEAHQELAIAAWERAHSSFQYFYHFCRLMEDCKVSPDLNPYLGKLIAFLAAPHFAEFISEVTGLNSLTMISSTATLYKPLDFLKTHTDMAPGPKRLVAYALNMTPNWHPDWGGALQFFDRPDHIEEVYLPTFNGLSLFRVPKPHSVSQVAVFGGVRYAVSGWFVATGPDLTDYLNRRDRERAVSAQPEPGAGELAERL